MSHATQRRREPRPFEKLPKPPRLPKGLLLYILPLPLVAGALYSLVQGDPYGIVVNTIGYLLFCLAAHWLQQGFDQQTDLRQKKSHASLVKPQPLKTHAALTVAVTTALLAWLGAGYSLWIAPLFGLASLGGMYLYYGFEPRSLPLASQPLDRIHPEVAEAIAEAEALLEKIEAANRLIDHRHFHEQIEQIVAVARDILEQVAADPGDLRRARKFLKVYLEGARKVTEGYAKTPRQARSSQLEANFQALLETIEQVFRQQHQKLLENEIFDLDVQIEVLQSRLKQEGFSEP